MTLRFRPARPRVRLCLLLLTLAGASFVSIPRAQAQADDLETLASNIEINSLGTSYDQATGVASAVGEVEIKYEDVEIYADKAEFHRTTGDIFARENVTIYKGELAYKGDAAVYNIQTGKITANHIRSSVGPALYDSGEINLNTEDLEVISTTDTFFTTHDSVNPNYHLKAKTVDIYPDDRIVFRNVKIYAGKVPVLWLPYLSQPFDDQLGYTFTPGYTSTWGAFLLNQYGILVGDHSLMQFKLDLRSERGVAGGIDVFSMRHRDNPNFGHLELYYANDSDPGLNFNSLERPPLDKERYRIGLQHRIYIPGPEESSFYFDIDINKVSDEFMLEDFYPEEFRLDPRPDNMVNLVRQTPRGELSVWARFRANDFFQTDSRLPEVAIDFTRQPIFNSGFFYEGESSVGIYKEAVADTRRPEIMADIADTEAALAGGLSPRTDPTSPLFDPLFDPAESATMLDDLRAALVDDEFTRFDTYHQILYPFVFGDWLSLVPRVGVRATAYSDVSGGKVGGSETRVLGHAGIEASTKFSKLYPNAQMPRFGVNEFRHIFQPYLNYSYLGGDNLPEGYPLIDRFGPTTRLRPIDPQLFTATDEFREWNVLRLGGRNRLQTKRDGGTHNWLEIDTFFETFFNDAELDRDFSNLFNEIRWSPLPWVRLDLDTQLPVFNDPFDFTEVNTDLTFMPNSIMQFTVGHRLLTDNPLFEESNLVSLYSYTKLTENWGFSTSHRYEFEDSTMEWQQYSLHRDLSSWTAAVGAMVRDNRGDEEYGFVFTLSLKDFPQVSLPLSILPGGENR